MKQLRQASLQRDAFLFCLSQTGNFTISAENAAGEETSDASNTGFGLGYAISDSLKFGVYQVNGEDKVTDTEYNETAASLTYTIAPGLTTNLAYLTADTDTADTSTSYSSTTAYIKVSF